MNKININISILARRGYDLRRKGTTEEHLLMNFVHRIRIAWNLYQAEVEEQYGIEPCSVDFDLETNVDAE
jgi:hypothetical protein